MRLGEQAIPPPTTGQALLRVFGAGIGPARFGVETFAVAGDETDRVSLAAEATRDGRADTRAGADHE
jgi:hypothetical protein